MYIIIEHEISNPNREGTKAVCLWEATGVDEVKVFVENALRKMSRNTYFAVEAKNAVGLPTGL